MCMYKKVCIYVQCIYVRVYVGMYELMYVYKYICMYARMHVCTYLRMYNIVHMILIFLLITSFLTNPLLNMKSKPTATF